MLYCAYAGPVMFQCAHARAARANDALILYDKNSDGGRGGGGGQSVNGGCYPPGGGGRVTRRQMCYPPASKYLRNGP